MKTILKALGALAVVFVVVAVVAGAVIYMVSNARMSTAYSIGLEPVLVSEAPDVIAKGEHLTTIRGCRDCHGENMGGMTFIDAQPMATLYGSNLTAGKGGVMGQYTNEALARAIRHGVDEAGNPLLFMPSHEFFHLSDDDVGAIISYLRSLPPVDNEMPENNVGPVGRLLYLTGQLPLLPVELIDHEGARMEKPPVGPTAAYGEYLATGCTGCHGAGFSGGKIPGTPPEWPDAANLTPNPDTGLGLWTEADFFRAMREGKRPDGSDISPFMPWKVTAQMTDVEVAAIWAYLQQIPPQPHGNR